FPKIKIRELKEDYAKFELRDTDAFIANALYRVMIAEVPTIAIDLIKFKGNSSILNDQLIAHQLSLIPLTSERAMSMQFSRDCDACDSDGQFEFCSVEFHLRAKCMNDQTLDVTSNDLYSYDHMVVPVNFTDSAGYNFSKQRFIVKLRRGQGLRLGAITRKRIRKDHVKWSPAATTTFIYKPEIHINEYMMDTLMLEEKQSFIESSPTRVFDIDPNTQQVLLLLHHYIIKLGYGLLKKFYFNYTKKSGTLVRQTLSGSSRGDLDDGELEGDTETTENMDPTDAKHAMRMRSNRESARRSRRKQAHMNELEEHDQKLEEPVDVYKLLGKSVNSKK
ncbi:DNA-directed RNA polymerases II, IV and V subunit 3-like, partial [Hibiscus syriacus]|uniref:DNA-directed RNA polymerases II, IV and V subunit 3-like n=1 Tax=Hibiscus syriacus TaxID=106335 RepID=UPI0019246083